MQVEAALSSENAIAFIVATVIQRRRYPTRRMAALIKAARHTKDRPSADWYKDKPCPERVLREDDKLARAIGVTPADPVEVQLKKWLDFVQNSETKIWFPGSSTAAYLAKAWIKEHKKPLSSYMTIDTKGIPVSAGLLKQPYVVSKYMTSLWSEEVELDVIETATSMLSGNVVLPADDDGWKALIGKGTKYDQSDRGMLDPAKGRSMIIMLHKSIEAKMGIRSNLPTDSAMFWALISACGDRGIELPVAEAAQLIARDHDGNFRPVQSRDKMRVQEAMEALRCMTVPIPGWGYQPALVYDISYASGPTYKVRRATWVKEVSELIGKKHGFTYSGLLTAHGLSRFSGKANALPRIVAGTEYHLGRLSYRTLDGNWKHPYVEAKPGEAGPWMKLHYREFLKIIGDGEFPDDPEGRAAAKSEWQKRRRVLTKHGYLSGGEKSDTVHFRITKRGYVEVRASPTLCTAAGEKDMRQVSLRDLLELP